MVLIVFGCLKLETNSSLLLQKMEKPKAPSPPQEEIEPAEMRQTRQTRQTRLLAPRKPIKEQMKEKQLAAEMKEKQKKEKQLAAEKQKREKQLAAEKQKKEREERRQARQLATKKPKAERKRKAKAKKRQKREADTDSEIIEEPSSKRGSGSLLGIKMEVDYQDQAESENFKSTFSEDDIEDEADEAQRIIEEQIYASVPFGKTKIL